MLQQELCRRKRAKAVFPIGIACLAARIRGTHDVRIFDPNVYELGESPGRLRRAVDEFRPDVVGLSIKYVDTGQLMDPHVFYGSVKSTVEGIRESAPEARIVAGGPGFSMFPLEIMEDNADIDYGVCLEGEDAFSELLERLDEPEKVAAVYYRSGGRVVFSGQRSPPSLRGTRPLTAVSDLFRMGDYISDDYQIFGFQSKRGCPMDCAYCNYPYLNGTGLRLRDAKDVVDEIEHMVRRHGLRAFSFADNVFNHPCEHAIGVCREISRRGLIVEWGAWYDPAGLTSELVGAAVEAGCRHFDFSPDATTEEGLKALGKACTLEDIYASMRLLKPYREAEVSYNFFVSYPGQTVWGAARLLGMWFGIVSSMFGRSRVGVGWIRIMPHTRMHDIAVREGAIEPGRGLFVRDSRELGGMFYHKPGLWPVEAAFKLLVMSGERVIKPILKAAGRPFGIRYPFYY